MDTPTAENEVNTDRDVWEKIIEDRISSLGVKPSLDNFLGSIDGIINLSIGTKHSRIDQMSGDVVFFDNNWLVTGSAMWNNISNGWSTPIGLSIDYDSSSDSTTWVFANKSKTYPNTSSGSPIQVRTSFPEQRVLAVFRESTSWYGYYKIHAGSYLKIDNS